MNGKQVGESGPVLRVSQFKQSIERGTSIAANSNSTTGLFTKRFNNLFVKNFPKANFSAEELRAVFEPFGEIVSVTVQDTEEAKGEEPDADADAKKPTTFRGFGFVCFKRSEDARKALEYFHEKTDESTVSMDVSNLSLSRDDSSFLLNLPKLYVVPALKKELREAYVRMRSLKFKRQMARQNLYFRGFPLDPATSIEDTEQELREFFTRFGEVSNIKLMQARKPKEAGALAGAPTGESLLGFGFCCYKSVEDAQRARVEAPKQPFKGCTLFISQFETREQRRAHMLERIDQIEFARYKKREEMRKDMERLQKLSDDLRTEQG